MNNLYTVRETTIFKLEIKKSLFIAHLIPESDFQETIDRLRNEHRKARHFVWAIRQLNEYQQIVENCSDDGEPRNTSGKPTLKVLQGHDLINAGIITVRYFGGIKLGTGGLVRAYTEAAQGAVKLAKPVALSCLHQQTVRIPYPQLRHVEYLLSQHKLIILKKNFATPHIELTVQGDERTLQDALKQIDTRHLN